MLLVDSPIGPIAVHATDVVHQIRLGAEASPLADAAGPTDLEREVGVQLSEYFSGQRQRFELPLDPTATPLQQQVWQQLDEIPYGNSVSYGHIARHLGLEPSAARAIGGAVGANPVLIVRPCHRVVGADGSLTGYAGGIDAKLWLLQHEGVLL